MYNTKIYLTTFHGCFNESVANQTRKDANRSVQRTNLLDPIATTTTATTTTTTTAAAATTTAAATIAANYWRDGNLLHNRWTKTEVVSQGSAIDTHRAAEC